MKLSQIFFSVTIGFLVYMVGIGIYGEGGYLALQSKYTYIEELEANNKRLEELQGRLTDRVILAENSEEVMEREAHRLGFIADDQVLVRLHNKPISISSDSPGVLLRAPRYIAPDASLSIAAGLIAGLSTLLLFLLKPRRRKDRRDDDFIQSSRVQIASRK